MLTLRFLGISALALAATLRIFAWVWRWGRGRVMNWYFTRVQVGLPIDRFLGVRLPDHHLPGRAQAIHRDYRSIVGERTTAEGRCVGEQPTAPRRLPPLPNATAVSRSPGGTRHSGSGDPWASRQDEQRPLRIVTLNMEMARQLGRVCVQMERLQPDIILLQEVDVGVPRTRGVDSPAEIAARLGMEYVFATEVEDPCVRPSFGANSPGGRQGNAILSRYPLDGAAAIRLTCQRKGWAKKSHESYKWHVVAAAVAHTPSGAVECYSAHLDAHKNGPSGRAAQYHELCTAIRERHIAGRAVVVTGDFNTVTSGIAQLRRPEAVWFSRHAVAAEHDAMRRWRPPSGHGHGHDTSTVTRAPDTAARTTHLHREEGVGTGVGTGSGTEPAGSSDESGDEAGLILADPFDKRRDVTMVALGGLLRVKLDWVLLSVGRFRVVRTAVGSRRTDSCSDHFWVAVDAQLLPLAQGN